MRRRREETIGACPALLPTKAYNAELTQYQGVTPAANHTMRGPVRGKARYTFGSSGTEVADGGYSA